MITPRRKNFAGYYDELGRFRPIRSPQFVGAPKRRATVRDRKKYSRAKAGDLGGKRQTLAREDVFDREIRLGREAKELSAKDRQRLERQILRDVTEGGGHMSTGKPQTLVQFVRSAGGVNTKLRVRRGRKKYGDLENFTLKGSGVRGLVTTTPGKGKSLDYMHQAARESGFDVVSLDDLLDKMDDEIRSGKPTYSTHGSLSYNPKNPNMDLSGQLRVMEITPKSYGVFLRKWCLKKFRTKAAAETYRDSIRARRTKVKTNPAAEQSQNIPIAKILTGNGEQTIFDAIRRLKEEAFVPKNPDRAITVTRTAGGNYLINDGFHRTALAIIKGRKTIKANVREVNPGDPLSAFAQGAWGLLSALQIQRMLQKPKRRKAVVKKAVAHAGSLTTNGRGRTTAKRRATRKNPHGSGGLPKGDVTYHERQFDRLISAIEDGNLTKINKAKLEGRLAGYSPREVEYLIYRSRMASALKRNPAPKVIAKAVKLVGNGGRFKRFLARRKAASAFRKELRLEAALGRARKRKEKRIKEAMATNPKRRRTSARKPAVRKRKVNARSRIVKKAVTRSARKNPLRRQASAKSPVKAASKNPVRRRKVSVTRKRNAAPRSRTFEMFQGRKPTNAKPMVVSRHAPKTIVQLGDLIELKLHGQAPIKFNPKLVKLCAANGKLWIAGKRFAKANPAAKANEINPVAAIDHVVYGTHKPHHGDHAYTHYIHKLGEVSGRRPVLAVDREGFPVIRGGNYRIEARGIVD